MWPLISSRRISSACEAASSGVSANFTPPAFMRPPVSTCDLMTVGPPISSAARRASSAVVAKPCADTGIPALATILLRFVFEEPHEAAEPYPGRSMRLATCLLALFLLLPATAQAAELTIDFAGSVGGAVRLRARDSQASSRQDGAPLAGQTVSIQARNYPFRDALRGDRDGDDRR